MMETTSGNGGIEESNSGLQQSNNMDVVDESNDVHRRPDDDADNAEVVENDDIERDISAQQLRLYNYPQEQNRRRRQRPLIIVAILLLPILGVVAIVAGVCGSGHCGSSSSNNSKNIEDAASSNRGTDGTSNGDNITSSTPIMDAVPSPLPTSTPTPPPDSVVTAATTAPVKPPLPPPMSSPKPSSSTLEPSSTKPTAAPAPQQSLSPTTLAPSSSSPTTITPTLSPTTASPAPTKTPLNDRCSTAIGPLRIGGKAVAGTIIIPEDVAPPPTCTGRRGTTTATENGARNYGLWYTVTGGGEVIRASTCPRRNVVGGGSRRNTTSIDTQISIYTGDGSTSSTTCDDSSLQCHAYNDQFCGDQSSVSWYAEKGVTYYVWVSSSTTATTTSGGGNSNFQLRVHYEENGDCARRIGPLATDGSLIAGSMRGSTASSGAYFSCDVVNPRGGRVYYWVVGTGSWMIASTCHEATEFSARLDVYAGDCTLNCVAFRDSDCGSGNQVAWKSEAGAEYTILVFKSSRLPGIVFDLSIDSLDPVENDACESALPLSVDDGSSITTTLGSTLLATFENSISDRILTVPDCQVPNLQPGVWYTVSGTGERLLASTCNDSTDYSSEISVYRGGCDGLVCVATGSQYCNEKASVFWDSVDGETYHLLVHGSDNGVFSDVGDFGLTIEPFVTEPNDLCTDAITLDPATGEVVSSSNFAATFDLFLPQCNPFYSEAPGIWYKVVGQGRNLRASTCDPATDYDTQISIYSGSCDSLRCVNSDDNSCGLQSSVAWSATQGVTYFILVHGRFESSVGRFTIMLEEYVPLVENDFCDAAVTPPIDGSMVLGTTVGATFDNAGFCGFTPDTSPGVWYKVQGTGRAIVASLCNDETNYDTALSVYTGDCVNLYCVDSNSDGVGDGCGLKSELGWLSFSNLDYYILIHGFDTRVGDFGLSVSEWDPTVRNDFCVDAIPLPLSATTIFGTTIGATVDYAPPCSDIAQDVPGVWYTVRGTGERIVASTCNEDGNPVTDFDTRVSVFTGSCGNFTCTLADDDFCDAQSRLVWLTEEDVTYYILVHGSWVGNFGLVVNTFVPLTTNDFCTAAQGPILPSGGTVYGSTERSSFDEMGNCGAINTSPGVWFFVVGTGELLTADTCNERTDFDTKVSVFTGQNCLDLTCVAGNDDGCGFQSSISWDSEIGIFYWVLVHGWSTYGVGNFGLTISGSELFQ